MNKSRNFYESPCFFPQVRYNISTQTPRVLNKPRMCICSQISDGILIWLESGELSYCLFVDELLGEQQVVVKPLPSYLSRFNIKQSGIAGCTILGDGNISIILDISNLYTPA